MWSYDDFDKPYLIGGSEKNEEGMRITIGDDDMGQLLVDTRGPCRRPSNDQLPRDTYRSKRDTGGEW
jgi:hypothetical protein